MKQPNTAHPLNMIRKPLIALKILLAKSELQSVICKNLENPNFKALSAEIKETKITKTLQCAGLPYCGMCVSTRSTD